VENGKESVCMVFLGERMNGIEKECRVKFGGNMH